VSPGDLRDDTNAEFAREFYRALSVVCDDLFFSRYRRESSAVQSLADSEGVSIAQAARDLLETMYGDTVNEDEKARVVDGLLDTRLLPATDVEGVEFNEERLKER
jgi:hypothetical protein